MVQFGKNALNYEYDALEPHIDKQTMQIHYEKHHQTYCDKLNAAITEFDNVPEELEELLANISQYSVGIRNNAGGVWNHNFFWKSMTPNGSEMSDSLKDKISSEFGSVDEFKTEFKNSALGQFGSGWAWLIQNEDGSLDIVSTPNQDNPVMDIAPHQGTPLLGVDVWEHAYYLKYQNKRPDYVDAFFNVVNWDEVERRMK